MKEMIRRGSLRSRPATARAAATLLAATFLVGACSGATSTPTPATPASATPAGATSAPETAAPETAAPAAACKPEEIRLVGQVRNVSNPYEAAWLGGGDFFADSVGLKQQKLTYDGDSQKQDSQVRTLLASGNGGCTILNVLPNNDGDTPVVVKAAQDAGAWIVTQWNKPVDLWPWDGYDHWISHITYDSKDAGYQIGKALIQEMGGKGNIVALQGVLDAAASKDRFAGLEQALAENPGVKLLDQQTANFVREQALTVTKTWITKYGDQINGIWAANDDMGLGALQALKPAGLAGKVPIVSIDAVPEALKGIQEGTFTATITTDPTWQGGIGLAMGYCVLTGKLDVASISHDNRSFFASQALITKDNVDKYVGTPDPAVYASEWGCDKLFSRFFAAMYPAP